MDTKTLVVGQDVYMFSENDSFTCGGKVVKVISAGVVVEACHGEIYFDSVGNEYDCKNVSFGYEYGPWHIDDMPFAERKALLEQANQRYRDKKMLPFFTWWKSATYEQRLEIIKKLYKKLYKDQREPAENEENVARIADISSDFNRGWADVLEPCWRTSGTPSEQIKGEPR